MEFVKLIKNKIDIFKRKKHIHNIIMNNRSSAGLNKKSLLSLKKSLFIATKILKTESEIKKSYYKKNNYDRFIVELKEMISNHYGSEFKELSEKHDSLSLREKGLYKEINVLKLKLKE